ncbi:acetate--CoA ligase family protein [Nocardia sp. R7R-8]|uniref:acetate--CoA ligase family protein n=1 Tax=Nocardia sp. R7R-8 TaxID=3459304 RepID=UPI00403D9C9C
MTTTPTATPAGSATSEEVTTTAAASHRLRRLFDPRVIAVVGASASSNKAGGALMEVLESFPGPLYPINPSAEHIHERRAYPRISDVPEKVDLAIIAVPPPAVVGVIEDCREAGVGAAVICTGGFAESGADGRRLQEEVVAAASEAGIRILGPNTSGFIVPSRSVHATFMPAVHGLTAGSLAVVAQSGGVNLASAFMASQRGCGISLAVGLGNAADVDFVEVLDYLARDDATTAIALHVEGVPDGRALMDAVRRVTTRKPVVALQVGQSDVRHFAKSHTGAIAGNWAVARAGLEQAGAVVVDSLTDLIDAACALSVMRLPPNPQPGIGIVTGQAGPGLIITDGLSTAGVRIPEVSVATTERLSRLLPPLTYQRNPVDTGRPGPTFFEVMTALGDDAEIDALVVYALQEAGTAEVVDALRNSSCRDLPPVLMVTGGPEDIVTAQRDTLRAAGYATLDAPDRAAFVMSALVADARARARLALASEGRADHRANSDIGRIAGHGLLDEYEGKDLLEQIGIPTPHRAVCHDAQGAEQAFADMTKPVVVKVLDANLTHKSAAGGVRLGVTTREELHDALAATAAAGTSGARWLIEEQAPSGIELIVGGVRDTAFGPAILLGAGGTTVEWGVAPQIRIAPLTETEAAATVQALPPPLVKALGDQRCAELCELVVRVATFLADHPEIAELDINPLRATDTGFVALDAVFRLVDPTSPTDDPTHERNHG